LTGDQWAYSLILGFISIPVGFVLQAIPTVIVEKPMAWMGKMWDKIRRR
jgi:Ca2+-transporting ATPase